MSGAVMMFSEQAKRLAFKMRSLNLAHNLQLVANEQLTYSYGKNPQDLRALMNQPLVDLLTVLEQMRERLRQADLAHAKRQTPVLRPLHDILPQLLNPESVLTPQSRTLTPALDNVRNKKKQPRPEPSPVKKSHKQEKEAGKKKNKSGGKSRASRKLSF
ncbi:MAG TPA: hypothetical protein VLG38_00415 [Gammaproteobacteria bacterium]|nr:hypothetical protein [Gammaproteobacteria bacterium]